jgi:hypothetical protein
VFLGTGKNYIKKDIVHVGRERDFYKKPCNIASDERTYKMCEEIVGSYKNILNIL